MVLNAFTASERSDKQRRTLSTRLRFYQMRQRPGVAVSLSQRSKVGTVSRCSRQYPARESPLRRQSSICTDQKAGQDLFSKCLAPVDPPVIGELALDPECIAEQAVRTQRLQRKTIAAVIGGSAFEAKTPVESSPQPKPGRE